MYDWAGLLVDTVSDGNGGTWANWTVVTFAIERGLKHPSVESPRGSKAAEVDDGDKLLDRILWAIFDGGEASSI